MRKAAFLIIVMTVCFTGIVTAQKRLDTGRGHEFDEQLLYLPKEPVLVYFTGGMNSVVADFLWLRCVQYTSQQFRGEFKFIWLQDMCSMITRLDPNFTGAYQWGGVFLAMLKHDNDASIELLKSGIPANPTRWELPFEIARTYILNRHDEVNGARWLAVAASTGNPPQFVVDWAKNLQKAHGLYDVERAMWTDILENSADTNMREMAGRKLDELALRLACDTLTAAARQFAAQRGRNPAPLKELVDAGLVRELPVDSLGGHFFIDSKCVVRNSSVLDAMKEERVRYLRGAIAAFREKQGRWPRGLDELNQSGEISALPTHPYEGEVWKFDPATGSVR